MQPDDSGAEIDAEGILADPDAFVVSSRANPTGGRAAFAATWADDDLLAHFGARLLARRDTYEALRELVFSLVGSVRDVRCLLGLLDEDRAILFLDDFVLHRAASIEVVSALVASVSTFKLFPTRGAWVGHAMFVRGSSILRANPSRRYDVAELVPIGVDADRGSARALLSSAFETARLTEEAEAEVERLFPNDRSRPRRG